MKIALITLHNTNNYGAMFQAYATYKVLSRFGSVDIINYDNRHVSKSLDLIRVGFTFHSLLGTGKDLFRIFPRKRVIEKFNHFSDTYFTFVDVEGVEGYDVAVAGSDQIWNPKCISSNNTIDTHYFLDFVPKDVKKISYASSIGNYVYSKKEQIEITDLLSKFSAISLREIQGKSQLDSFLGLKVEHVLDPTLLLSKSEWCDYFNLKKKAKEEKYILVYSVPKSKLLIKAIEYFSKKLELPVIAIDQGLSIGTKVDKHIKDAGPLEFLDLFYNASFIITDSFHGTCFSVNFKKQFVSIVPPNLSNRVESFLGIIGFKDKIIRSTSCFDKISEISSEEYASKISKLDYYRSESINFLKNNC